MTAFQADVPDKYVLGDSWGLGWIRFGWDGQRLIGHDGNTIGQAAFLRVLPEPGGSPSTLLTNGGHTRDLYEDLYREIFAELAGVDDAAPARRRPARAGRGRHHAVPGPLRAGRRAHGGPRRRRRPGAAHDRSPARSPSWRPTRSHEYPMVAGRPRTCSSSRARARETWIPVTFYALPTGERVPALRCACHPEGGLTWTHRRRLLAERRCRALLADIEALVRASPRRGPASRSRACAGSPRVGAAAPRAPRRSGSSLDGRTHLRWRFGARADAGAGARPPRHGVAARLAGDAPVRRSTDGVLRGPGCFDMKAGAGAWRCTRSRRWPTGTGSRSWSPATRSSARRRSRALIEDEARGCRGRARARGVGRRRRAQDRAQGRLAVRGPRRSAARRTPASSRSAASTRPSSSRTRCSRSPALADPARGTTVTPTVASSGTTTQHRARAEARSSVDVRVWDAAEQERVDAAMRALPPVLAGRGARGRRRAEPAAAASRGVVGGAVRPRRGARRRARAAAAAGGRGRRRVRRQLHRRASARRRSTGSARSAAARTPTTSTSLVDALPGRTALLGALIDDLLAQPVGATRDDRGRSTMTRPRGPTGMETSREARRCRRRSGRRGRGRRRGGAGGGRDGPRARRPRRARGGGPAVRRDLGAATANPPVTARAAAGADQGRQLRRAAPSTGDACWSARASGSSAPPADDALHSHIAGRRRGLGRPHVGFALKLHQRAWALRRGVPEIAWTFDPLVSRNAYFNLVKLGARPVEYLPNFYGVMDDGINGGDETDRLLVQLGPARPGGGRGVRRAEPGSAVVRRRARRADAVGRARRCRRRAGAPVPGRLDGRTVLVARARDIEALRLGRPARCAGRGESALREVLTAAAGRRGTASTGFDRAGWYVVRRRRADEADRGGAAADLDAAGVAVPDLVRHRDDARHPAAAASSTDEAEGWGECVAMSDPLYSSEYVDAAADVLRRFLLPASRRGPAASTAPAVGRVLGAVQGTPDGQGGPRDGACSTPSCGPPGGRSRASSARSATGCRAASRSASWTRSRQLLDAVDGYLGRGLRADQAEDRAGLGRRAGARRARAVRRRPAAPGGREHRLHPGRRAAPGPARPVRPAADRAAAGRGGRARSRRAGHGHPTPICLDESITSARTAAAAIRLGACSIINIKPGRVGGYLEARRIHDVCAAHGIPVWCGGMLETGLGRAANVALAALPGLHAARRHLGVGPLLPDRHHRAVRPPRRPPRRSRPGPASGSRRCRTSSPRSPPRPSGSRVELSVPTSCVPDLVDSARSRLGDLSPPGGAVPMSMMSARPPRQPGPRARSTSARRCSTSSTGIPSRPTRSAASSSTTRSTSPSCRRGPLVLGVGPSRRPTRSPPCWSELGRVGAAALVVRAPVPVTREGRGRRRVRRAWPLLGLTRGASWTQLAAMLRSLLAEGDVGVAEAETLGGLPSGDLFAVANAIAALIDAPDHHRGPQLAGARLLRAPGRGGPVPGGDDPRPPGARAVLAAAHRARRLPRAVPQRPAGLRRALSPTARTASRMPRVAIAVRAGDEVLGSIWAAVREPLTRQRARGVHARRPSSSPCTCCGSGPARTCSAGCGPTSSARRWRVAPVRVTRWTASG